MVKKKKKKEGRGEKVYTNSKSGANVMKSGSRNGKMS